jgi:hypothetical protein
MEDLQHIEGWSILKGAYLYYKTAYIYSKTIANLPRRIGLLAISFQTTTKTPGNTKGI